MLGVPKFGLCFRLHLAQTLLHSFWQPFSDTMCPAAAPWPSLVSCRAAAGPARLGAAEAWSLPAKHPSARDPARPHLGSSACRVCLVFHLRSEHLSTVLGVASFWRKGHCPFLARYYAPRGMGGCPAWHGWVPCVAWVGALCGMGGCPVFLGFMI